MSSLVENINAIKLKIANTIAVISLVFSGCFLVLMCFREIPEVNAPIVHFLGGSFFSLLPGIGHFFLNYNNKKGESISHPQNAIYSDKKCINCPHAHSDVGHPDRDPEQL